VEDDDEEEEEEEEEEDEEDDISDLERTTQEIQNVKLNDSQEIKNKPEGDTSLVCYLEG
jgi:hypothetical protein